jgi:hypothetical protein
MRPYAPRRLTAAICAIAVVVPLVTATDLEASSRHTRKHQRMSHHYRTGGFNDFRAGREFRPVVPSWRAGGDVCPGSGRSFECKVWPPPFDQDPDRKASGSDAGG